MQKIYLMEDLGGIRIIDAIEAKFWPKYEVILSTYGKQLQEILRQSELIQPNDLIVLDGNFPLFEDAKYDARRLWHIFAYDIKERYELVTPTVIHTAEPFLFNEEKDDLALLWVEIIEKSEHYRNLIDWILRQNNNQN